jgi:glucose/arabinose dehydrogenase
VRLAGLLLLLPLAAWSAGAPLRGTRVSDRIRTGFVEQVIADSLNSPVSMAIAPDGRVFVCEQGGRLRVIKRDSLLARPFVIVPAVANQEEGLLGVAFDPDFPRNRRVYVSYTAAAPARHGVIAVYVASGDTALAGSGHVLFDLDDDLDHVHVGGALHFGADGTLLVATGENGEGGLSQSLRSTSGKLLRIRADGTIPSDNPFYALARGNRRAIWARGFRNAFSFDVQPGTGRIFVNDVGGSEYEEIDDVVAGGNYGWPIFEGPGHHEKFRFPIHSYDHAHGCAITGGAFYNPPRPRFGSRWVGRYFYAEYCLNEIRWIDPVAPARYTVFGTTLAPGPVDLRVGTDGALYYLARGNSSPTGGNDTSSGVVVRITRSRGRG